MFVVYFRKYTGISIREFKDNKLFEVSNHVVENSNNLGRYYSKKVSSEEQDAAKHLIEQKKIAR